MCPHHKVTHYDFQSFIAKLTEQGIKHQRLPQDLVMSEESLHILENMLGKTHDNILKFRDSDKLSKVILLTLAEVYIRGYAEGKYHD